MRERDREKLKRVNKEEVAVLVERWSSNEFVQVVSDFFSRKAKL